MHELRDDAGSDAIADTAGVPGWEENPHITLRHSAGSKARPMPLMTGVTGSAVFAGDRDEHRMRLDRIKGDSVFGMPFALWIGMNPSRAEALDDDLTVRKEQTWTWGWGLNHYIKTNVGTWRSTSPAALSSAPDPVHPDNLRLIRELAGYANRIVLSIGKPPDVLLGPTRTMFRALKADGRAMECFGTTKDGWPVHTSRLGYDVRPRRFAP